VVEVERDCLHPDAHLARSGRGDRHVVELEHLRRAAVLVRLPRSHHSCRSPVSWLRRARARRLPSCIACTRGIGMACPSATRSSGNGCGLGVRTAHGSRSPSDCTAFCTVKSVGTTSSRSSQSTGNDTGTPGRTRGLYAATTVAPPTRVGSTNTL